MSDLGADKKIVDEGDLEKIHSEINQAVNQRFLLTAGAITAFGFMSTNILNTHENETLYLFNASSYLILVIILYMLFVQSKTLRSVLRIYSTYLKERKVSIWEKHWSEFRKYNERTNKISKSDLVAHTLIFRGLSAISMVLGGVVVYITMKIQIVFDLPTLVVTSLGLLINIIFILDVWLYGMTPSYNEKEISQDWGLVLSGESDDKRENS